jgi:hypothetical protein
MTLHLNPIEITEKAEILKELIEPREILERILP